MSEEEIIEDLKSIVEYISKNGSMYCDNEDRDAIQGILDLYNKEKEKSSIYYYELKKLEANIVNNIQELENNDTYGYVGEEWNDREVVELLKELLGEENEKL